MTVEGAEVIGPEQAEAVLLLHPWWGVTPAVRWWADQLVAAGRRVVLPDLYHGRVVATIEAAESMQEAADEDEVNRIIDGCADQLSAEGRRWDSMGFSWGAFLACRRLAGRGAAGPRQLTLFYSGWPPEGDDVRTERVEIHFAPGDPYFSDEELEATVQGFESHGCSVQRYRYEESGHWFAEAGSPGYDRAATELALGRVLAQLRPTSRTT